MIKKDQIKLLVKDLFLVSREIKVVYQKIKERGYLF